MRALFVCLLLLAMTALAPAANAAGRPSQKIVGGSAASAGEYPAQAYVTAGAFACGGTLVAPNKVLTAAHCVNATSPPFPPAELPANVFEICLGELDINDCAGTDIYDVTDVDMHASYDPSSNEFDVGMLTLDRDAPFTPLRLVDTAESALWDDEELARIIG